MTAVIGKSGTGIGKSGTGIGKSGTGVGLGSAFSLALTALALLAVPVQTLAGSDLMVTEHKGSFVLSLHAGDQVVVGSVSRSELAGGYQAFALYSALEYSEGDAGFRPLIKGSGSGASGESDCAGDASLLIKGSGSGASGESACKAGASLLIKGSGSGASGESACDEGASLLIKGSGSGASGESVCDEGASLLIKGSGSGASGESVCDEGAGLLIKGSGSGASGESARDQGAGLLIKGSGSGASGESASDCMLPAATWGVAEILVDEGGIQVLVHRIGNQGLEEYLVASIATVTRGGDEKVHHADFVALP